MLTKSELLALLAENNRKLVELLWRSEPKADKPEPPEPSEPRKLRQSEMPGISMNELARRIPKPRPPSAPGQQTRRHNGAWWHY